MLRIIYLLIALLVKLSLFSQQSYYKNFESSLLPTQGDQLALSGDSIFLMAGVICGDENKECSRIYKVDVTGNINFIHQLSDFDPGNHDAIWIVNDTLTITGHFNIEEDANKYFMRQLDFSGNILNDFQWTFDYPQSLFILNYGAFYYNSGWNIFGASKASDGSVDAVLLQTDLHGNEKCMDIWDDGLREKSIEDIEYHEELDELIILSQTQAFNSDEEFQSFEYLSDECLTTGVLSNEINADPFVLKKFTASGNNIYIIRPLSPNPGSRPNIVIIDEYGDVFKVFDFNHVHGKDLQRYVNDITTAENGDIFGAGFYSRVGGKNTAWIFRLNPAGELLWEKTYEVRNWETGEQIENGINAIKELNDGSLLATGWHMESSDFNAIPDVMVMKVSPDGCLYENECDFLQFTTSTKNDIAIDQSTISIYPNPSSNEIKIGFPKSVQSGKIIIHDVSGVNVFEKTYDYLQDSETISIVGFPEGVYNFSLYSIDKSGCIYTERFVKVD